MKTAPTITLTIHLAGCCDTAQRLCAEYCDEVGFCVTVTPTQFIYTGGQEAGVSIGLVNYPRFPSDTESLTDRAITLAMRLREGMGQDSVMVVAPCVTYWMSKREDPIAS